MTDRTKDLILVTVHVTAFVLLAYAFLWAANMVPLGWVTNSKIEIGTDGSR